MPSAPLSQVRETAVFGGIAVAERLEGKSGVWVLDLVSGGTVAYLKLKEAVQEIFTVQGLHGRRYLMRSTTTTH